MLRLFTFCAILMGVLVVSRLIWTKFLKNYLAKELEDDKPDQKEK